MNRDSRRISTVLGISAWYHDSAACLVQDGRIVAAAQEERFSRRKNDPSFPTRAVNWCLSQIDADIEDIDLVAYYEQPRLKFQRLCATWLEFAPRGLAGFCRAIPLWVPQRLRIRAALERELGGRPRQGFFLPEHHQSHAAAAFFPSPFEEACILTLDGVGEWTTASVGLGKGNEIKLIREMRFPHSPGLLYAAFTAYAGFRVNSGEYEFMGLADYGRPVYRDWILENLVDLKQDGSFRLNLDYFAFCHADTMTSPLLEASLGWPPRRYGEPIRQQDRDLAASIQSVMETIVLKMAHHAHELSGCRNLVLAGGVALNCVANGRLLRESPFEKIWVQPAANDAGGALGAALMAWHTSSGTRRIVRPSDSQLGSRLGPRFKSTEIQSLLEDRKVVYSRVSEEEELTAQIAGLLAEGNIIGHFEGAMEFGPRALGGRSILADPRQAETRDRINRMVKFRDTFRPFAPAVLQERASEFFAVTDSFESPYMAIVAPVRPQSAPSIPAVTHVRSTARIQTVDPRRSPRFRGILEAFDQATGIPVLLNTSFNVRGEPIVCSPEDALRCFVSSGLDVLVLEDFLVLKANQDMEHLRARSGGAPDVRDEEPAPDGEKLPGIHLFLIFLLAIIYIGLLSPVAWLLRTMGWDALDLRHSAHRTSFWKTRRDQEQSRDSASRES